VLFKADFNKTLSSITQISHVNSRNLAIYGQRASMDDVRFEEMFDVYTTDQIGARYALSPALMEKFTQLCLRLDAPVNAVLRDSQIFIAVETWRDDFEPQLGKSLTDEATLTAYESEIESFTQIVKELNLNRKIW
jgi:hydrogenase expression/formation protein